MKLKIGILFLMSFVFLAPTFLADETISSTQEQIEQLEKEASENSKEIASTKEEVETLKQKIIDLHTQIDENNGTIEKLNIEIPKLEKNASDMLVFMQQVKSQTTLINYVFEDSEISAYKKAHDLNILIDDAVATINELAAKKKELSSTQELLALQEEQVSSEQKKLSESLVSLEDKEEMLAADLEIQQSYLDLYEKAGCKGDQVYGVDCGVSTTSGSANIISTGEFLRPISSGYVTAEFGYYEPFGVPDNHNGMDFDGDSAIYPVADGTVVSSGYNNGGYGNYVTIVHNVNGKPVYSMYAHLSSSSVSAGQTVTTTNQIGVMGDTGSSTATHVHLEIREGSNFDTATAVNPRKYIEAPNEMVYFEGR